MWYLPDLKSSSSWVHSELEIIRWKWKARYLRSFRIEAKNTWKRARILFHLQFRLCLRLIWQRQKCPCHHLRQNRREWWIRSAVCSECIPISAFSCLPQPDLGNKYDCKKKNSLKSLEQNLEIRERLAKTQKAKIIQLGLKWYGKLNILPN